MAQATFDIAIAGAGLAGTLTAAFLRRKSPSLRIALIGRGGPQPSQTWSFHAQDLSEDANNFLAPLVSCTWAGYSVDFPDHSRRLHLTYNSIRSHDFWQRINQFLPEVERIEGEIRSLTESTVSLASGATVAAKVVLDARGMDPEKHPVSGWQKFVGIEIETSEPHGITEPVIMDATVPQRDGYRFFYLLPYSTTRLLVEDTYYSDHPDLNEDMILREIRRYLHSMGIDDYSTSQQESGSLPIPLDMNWMPDRRGAEKIGMAGGFFHPTTGYSLPFAVRCAESLAKVIGNDGNIEKIPAAVRACRTELVRSSSFLVRLNRMLFRAGQPDFRWKILSQFYRRNEKVISRFYSGRLRFSTMLAMITGAPPVPVLSGIRHFLTEGPSDRQAGELQHG